MSGAAPAELLLKAAGQGDLTALASALAAGADVNSSRDSAGNTALHVAALRGNREVAVVLFRHGAAANAVNKGGSTPLHLAARIGAAEVVELLLAQGAELNALTSTSCTALHKACQNNQLAAARLLLVAGADVTILNSDKKTASDVAGNMSMRVLLKSPLRPVTIVSSAAAVQGAAAWGSPDARVSVSVEP